MKSDEDYKRMRITYHQQDGFKCDIPYSGWVLFCIGLSMLFKTLQYLLLVVIEIIKVIR